jgi:amino acid permease
VGKPLSLYLLILATILVYYYILSNYWKTFYNNKVYLTIVTILLLMDITMIIILFSISHNCENEKRISEIKKIKKKKSKKDKKKIELKDELSKNKSPEKEILLNDIPQDEYDNKSKKSIISLYNADKEVSLKTYN